jgi:hypothetical protein
MEGGRKEGKKQRTDYRNMTMTETVAVTGRR